MHIHRSVVLTILFLVTIVLCCCEAQFSYNVYQGHSYSLVVPTCNGCSSGNLMNLIASSRSCAEVLYGTITLYHATIRFQTLFRFNLEVARDFPLGQYNVCIQLYPGQPFLYLTSLYVQPSSISISPLTLAANVPTTLRIELRQPLQGYAYYGVLSSALGGAGPAIGPICEYGAVSRGQPFHLNPGQTTFNPVVTFDSPGLYHLCLALFMQNLFDDHDLVRVNLYRLQVTDSPVSPSPGPQSPCQSTESCCSSDTSSVCGSSSYTCCRSNERCVGGVCRDHSSSECYPNPTAPSIDLTQYGLELCPQACSQWCWATVISEVGNFIQGRQGNCVLDECSLASHLFQMKFGVPVNCCYMACTGQCNSPAPPQHFVAVLQSLGIYHKAIWQSLTENDLKLELSQKRPVIIAYTDGMFSGHVVVVYGYFGSNFLIADPWGGALFTTPYSQMRTYRGLRWTLTFYNMAMDSRCGGWVPISGSDRTKAGTPILLTAITFVISSLVLYL